MPAIDEETRKEIELAIIHELGKGYDEICKKLSQFQNVMLSLKMVLLGIWLGIIGNLVASYVIEFHLLIAGNNLFVGVVLGLIISAILVIYTEQHFKRKIIQPLEEQISELESFKEKVEKQIKESAKRAWRKDSS